MRRDRANGYIINTEQKSLSIAVAPLTYARELPATEWMKRMRHPHKTRGYDRITCISNGVTSAWRRDASGGLKRAKKETKSLSATKNSCCFSAVSIWRKPAAGHGIV